MPLSYSLSLVSPGTLPPFITLDSETNELSMQSNNVVYAGPYTLRVTATLAAGSITGSEDFSLTIVDPCPTAIISIT